MAAPQHCDHSLMIKKRRFPRFPRLSGCIPRFFSYSRFLREAASGRNPACTPASQGRLSACIASTPSLVEAMRARAFRQMPASLAMDHGLQGGAFFFLLSSSGEDCDPRACAYPAGTKTKKTGSRPYVPGSGWTHCVPLWTCSMGGSGMAWRDSHRISCCCRTGLPLPPPPPHCCGAMPIEISKIERPKIGVSTVACGLWTWRAKRTRPDPSTSARPSRAS